MAGLLDRLKGLVKDREGQIKSAVDKAGDFVDDKTKGKYHDKIAKAGEKADQVIDKVKADGPESADAPAATGVTPDPAAPTASATPATEAPAETVTDATGADTTGTDTAGTATDSAAGPGPDAGTDTATGSADKPSA